METRKILVIVMAIVLMSSVASGGRDYRHVITVGKDPNIYDYETIQEAIDAMNQVDPPLGPSVYGCIEINPGEYYHNSEGTGDPNEPKWLPAYCDLIGQGAEPDDVIISHPSTGTSVNQFILICKNDNLVKNVKFYNSKSVDYFARNGVNFVENGILEDCIAQTRHATVYGGENLTVKNCELYTYFVSCITAHSNFSVTDSQITILSAYDDIGVLFVETACGIRAFGSGVIENVTINGSDSAAYRYKGTGFFGIISRFDESEEVVVSDVQINLSLETKYRSGYEEPLRVCGIMSGKNTGDPDNSYMGTTVVRDCTISVTGIEDSGSDPCDPDDDGAGLMVDGICVRGGGTVEVWGYTDITTSRTTAGHAEDGYEYSLNNENGTLIVDVDPDLVSYDPNKTNGTISDLVRARNITQDEDYFTIQSAIDNANNFDVIEARRGKHYELIDFKGKAVTVQSSDPYDWDVVEATIIDANGLDDTVTFKSGEDANSVLKGFTIRRGDSAGVGFYFPGSPVISNCIIEENGYNGVVCQYAASPTIISNKISGSSGAGIFCGSGTEATILNNWIYDNNKGIWLISAGSTEITNNTIADNTGYGVRRIAGTSPTITNCIIWNDDNVDDLYGCSATYSCIEDADTGEGNIGGEPNYPLFIDVDNGDYHLQLDSPCINAGDPFYTAESGETDIDGNPRVMDFFGREDDAVVDMGGDEAFARAHNLTHDLYYRCIQDGIDDANDGDVIEVSECSLPEVINFKGKAITVRSSDPCDWDVVEATIIDGDNLYSTVTFDSGEDANSVLKGFTITNGKNYGVFCPGTSPVIRNCIIKNCNNGVRGSPVISNCNIHNNIKCGVWATVTARIRNNWIYDNANGIRLSLDDNSTQIHNNTIVDNTSYGIEKGFTGNPTPTIANCILWGNGTQLDPDFNDDITYSCIEDWTAGGDGNIATDPNFVDAANDDYHLNMNSPCIQAGDPCYSPSDGETDIDGEPRIMRGRVDMGADEARRVHNLTQGTWYAWIQDAIDDACTVDGDEIVALEDTYYENVDFDGKAITVRSSDPCDWDVVVATIIDAGGSGYTVRFDSGEVNSSVLKGFTVTNGSSYGIYCSSTDPVISNCIIEGNGSSGIYSYRSAKPTIRDSIIRDNGDRGIYAYLSTTYGTGSPKIKNNEIYDNSGYGIYIYVPSSARGKATPTIENNKIYGNATYGIYGYNSNSTTSRLKPTIKNNWIYSNGGTGVKTYRGQAQVLNNTIYGHTSKGIYKSSSGSTTVTNCIVWNNNNDLSGCSATYSCIQNIDAGPGNIVGDPNNPLFVNPNEGDYCLGYGSPCIDAANGNVDPPTDIFGQARIDDPNTPNTGIGDPNYVDMGAHEYNPN